MLHIAFELCQLSFTFALLSRRGYFFSEKEIIVLRGINRRLENFLILVLWIPNLVRVDCKVARFKYTNYIALSSMDLHAVL